MKKFLKYRKYLSLVYVCFFYYFLILKTLSFKPLLTNIQDPPITTSLYYFPWDNAAYIWPPSDDSSDVSDFSIGRADKILFFLPKINGNASLKFSILGKFQRELFSNYTIVQLELPGHGVSSELSEDGVNSFHIKQVYKIIAMSIHYFLTEHEETIQDYGFFIEEEAFCMFSTSIVDYLHMHSLKPKFVLFFNPFQSLYQKLCDSDKGCSLIRSLFFFPYYFEKTSVAGKKLSVLKDTRIIFIASDESSKNLVSRVQEVYLHFPMEVSQSKEIIVLQNKNNSPIKKEDHDMFHGFTSLILPENIQLLTKKLHV